jgi:hypothetical protein
MDIKIENNLSSGPPIRANKNGSHEETIRNGESCSFSIDKNDDYVEFMLDGDPPENCKIMVSGSVPIISYDYVNGNQQLYFNIARQSNGDIYWKIEPANSAASIVENGELTVSVQ